MMLSNCTLRRRREERITYSQQIPAPPLEHDYITRLIAITFLIFPTVKQIMYDYLSWTIGMLKRQRLCLRASGTEHKGPNNSRRSPWYSCLLELVLQQGESGSITGKHTVEDQEGSRQKSAFTSDEPSLPLWMQICLCKLLPLLPPECTWWYRYMT